MTISNSAVSATDLDDTEIRAVQDWLASKAELVESFAEHPALIHPSRNDKRDVTVASVLRRLLQRMEIDQPHAAAKAG